MWSTNSRDMTLDRYFLTSSEMSVLHASHSMLKMTMSYHEKSWSGTTGTMKYELYICDQCLWIDAPLHSLWETTFFRKSQIEALWFWNQYRVSKTIFEMWVLNYCVDGVGTINTLDANKTGSLASTSVRSGNCVLLHSWISKLEFFKQKYSYRIWILLHVQSWHYECYIDGIYE